MLAKLTQALANARLRRQMRDFTFAQEYAAKATDADWQTLVPRVTEKQLSLFRSLQGAVSPTLSFTELVTALEKHCPPEDEFSAVAGDMHPSHHRELGHVYAVTLGMTYSHGVNIMMTILYDQRNLARRDYATITSEYFDPEVYDELRTVYAWLNDARPLLAYAWLEQE